MKETCEMKVFDSLDALRNNLQRARIRFVMEGAPSTVNVMFEAVAPNDAHGKSVQIAIDLLTPEFLAHCANGELQFATLETLCRKPENKKMAITILQAITRKFWQRYRPATTGSALTDSFYFLYYLLTCTFNGEVPELVRYSTADAFGVYCVDRATEKS